MIDRYSTLMEYEDERIMISGVFEKFSFITWNNRDTKTALLQDVFAEVGGGLDIGHNWLQNADALNCLDLNYGDRIQCEVRVKSYKKRLTVPNRHGLMFENRLSLCWPTNVKLLSRLVCTEVEVEEPDVQVEIQPLSHQRVQPQAQPQEDALNPVLMIEEVRRLAKAMGGFDSLVRFVEALRA